MTRLSLISHAGTRAERAGRFPGADEPVSPTALTGLAPLGRALGRVDRLLAAPELRARQTATAFATEPVIAAALADGDFGEWRGRSLAEIEAADPAGVAAWLTDPASTPHGGESLLDLGRRVGAWLDAYSAPGHSVAVTHPGVIRSAIIHCLGAPPQGFWRVDVEPLSVTDLRRRGERWTLRSIGLLLR